MAELGIANIGGRAVPAWVLESTAEEIDNGIKSINSFSRPNLLDNWYFVGGGSQQGGGQFPINQRGQTSYTGDGYAIDRWLTARDGIITTIQDDRLHLSYQSADWILIQRLEGILRPGKTYTLSALYRASNNPIRLVCSWGPNLFFYNVQAPVAEDWTLVSVTGTIPDDATINYEQVIVQAIGTGEGTIDLLAVKLELGDHQTLARQDEDGNWVLLDAPPNFQQELTTCQRYLYDASSRKDNVAPIGIGFAVSSNTAYIYIPTPTMRSGVNSTLIQSGEFFIETENSYGTSSIQAESIQINVQSDNLVKIFVQGTGFVPGGPCALQARSAEGSLLFSREM